MTNKISKTGKYPSIVERYRTTITGDGEETVLLAHGLGLDQTTWRGVVEELNQRYTVITYDIPGASPNIPDDFQLQNYLSLSSFSDDLIMLIEALNIHKCHYVGHSVSGMIGALASIEAPEIFSKLTLINASPRYLNDTEYDGGFVQKDLEQIYAAVSSNYHEWVDGFSRAAVGVEIPAAIQEFSKSLLSMRPDITFQMLKTIFESDVRHILPLIKTKTVLIHSREDMAVPQTVALYLNDKISDSKIQWIDTPGHFPQLTEPSLIAQCVIEG